MFVVLCAFKICLGNHFTAFLLYVKCATSTLGVKEINNNKIVFDKKYFNSFQCSFKYRLFDIRFCGLLS